MRAPTLTVATPSYLSLTSPSDQSAACTRSHGPPLAGRGPRGPSHGRVAAQVVRGGRESGEHLQNTGILPIFLTNPDILSTSNRSKCFTEGIWIYQSSHKLTNTRYVLHFTSERCAHESEYPMRFWLFSWREEGELAVPQ